MLARNLPGLLIAAVSGGALSASIPAAANIFTLDPPSPTLSAGFTTYHILDDDPAGPILAIDMSDLGLTTGDVIDALSAGNDPIRPVHGTHDYVFSVSRGSRGVALSAVRLNQPDHEGDLFVSTGPFGNDIAPAPDGWSGMNGEEYNAGLDATTVPGDNVISVEYDTLSWTNPDPEDPASAPSFAIYFSLQAGSPSLGTYGATPGDVLVVGGTYGSTPSVFLAATDLGMPPGDDVDLDALALDVYGPNVVVRYSVTAGSPSFTLGSFTVSSGAAILGSRGTGTGRLVRTPASLGLRARDDLDALETSLDEEGGSDNPVQAFGLDHTALGLAELAFDGMALVASNIGVGGEDGFLIDYPIEEELTVDLAPIGPKPDGAFLEIAGYFRTDDPPQDAFMVQIEDAGEVLDLWIDSNEPTVQALLGGEVVAEAAAVAGMPAATLMDDTAWPANTVVGITDFLILAFPGPIWVELADGQTVQADAIRMITDFLPLTDLAITGSQLDQIVVINETIGTGCGADVNDDGAVDVNDLLEVILAWGQCDLPCGADVNLDGVVDVEDLTEVILSWDNCG